MEKDFYLNLITKEIDGSLSQDETEQLLLWRKSNPANESEYQETIFAWDKSENAFIEDTVPLVDVAGDFEILQKRIETESKSQVAERSSWNWSWAAAAAVLLIGFAWVWNAQTGQQMAWKELTTQESKSEVFLADGTKVTLDADSHLSYPERFDGDKRLVKLNGRAFFDVTKDATKPFIIEGVQESIKVLGTSFDFESRVNDSQSKVNVKSGRVLFFENENEENQNVELTAGKNATFDRIEKEMQPGKVGLADLNWQRPAIIFEDEPLPQVLNTLAEVFDVKIDCKVPITEACNFTSTFEDLPIEEALETLATVFDLKVEKLSDNHYSLSGDGC